MTHNFDQLAHTMLCTIKRYATLRLAGHAQYTALSALMDSAVESQLREDRDIDCLCAAVRASKDFASIMQLADQAFASDMLDNKQADFKRFAQYFD